MLQTFSPIRGMHVCCNATGDYVKKTDYEDACLKVMALRKALDWIKVRSQMEQGPYAEKIVEVATDVLDGTDEATITD